MLARDPLTLQAVRSEKNVATLFRNLTACLAIEPQWLDTAVAVLPSRQRILPFFHVLWR